MTKEVDEMPLWKRVLSLYLGLLECLCFSMLYFGWPSLVYVYKEEGVFAHLCDMNSTDENFTAWEGEAGRARTDCTEADTLFNLCFNIGLAVLLLSSFIVGIIFDMYGLWITRTIAT